MAVGKPRIIIVGVGPGSPDYVTPLARSAVERAEMLVGASRVLDLFPDSAAKRFPIDGDIDKALDRTLDVLAAGNDRTVAVLVTGDPGLFSLAHVVIGRFGRAACQVIPGVSSVQLAFACMGLDWHDARIVDAHTRVPNVTIKELASAAKTAVLTGCVDARTWLAEVGQALDATHDCIALTDLSLSSEAIRHVRPADLPELATMRRTILLFLRKDLLT